MLAKLCGDRPDPENKKDKNLIFSYSIFPQYEFGLKAFYKTTQNSISKSQGG